MLLRRPLLCSFPVSARPFHIARPESARTHTMLGEYVHACITSAATRVWEYGSTMGSSSFLMGRSVQLCINRHSGFITFKHRHPQCDSVECRECWYGRLRRYILYNILACHDLTRTSVFLMRCDQGNRTTPSYVAFTRTERLVGDAAKNQASPRSEQHPSP